MFQPKLRRVFTAAVLVGAFSLLSVQDVAAQPRSRWTGGEGVSKRLASPPSSLWEALASLLLKLNVRIDSDGVNKASVRIDPDGISKASVRIDPDGGH